MEHPVGNEADGSSIHLSMQRSHTILHIYQSADALAEMKQRLTAEKLTPQNSYDTDFLSVPSDSLVSPVSRLEETQPRVSRLKEAQTGATVFAPNNSKASLGFVSVSVSVDEGHHRPAVVERALQIVLPEKPDAVADKECRVCHLNLSNQLDCGDAMELGCACKADLAFAHRRCAETWFKIRGNRTCEICGLTAKNIMGIEEMEVLGEIQGRIVSSLEPVDPPWWNRVPLCNLLMSLVIAAFLLPWLFHVNLYG